MVNTNGRLRDKAYHFIENEASNFFVSLLKTCIMIRDIEHVFIFYIQSKSTELLRRCYIWHIRCDIKEL